MILQTREDVSEPRLRIDIVELGSLDQREDCSGAVTALVGAGEGPVMAAHDEGPDLPLGCVVGHAQPTVVEEARECHPSGEAVGDGLGDLALPGELGALFAQPSLQRDDERTALRAAHAQAFLQGDAIDLSLDREQGINALDRFDSDRRLVEPGELEEVAPRMCPARRLDDWARLAARAVEPVEPG